MSTESFTTIGTPASGPSGFPAARAASTAPASFSASGFMFVNAL
jgi:hypothetical protein